MSINVTDLYPWIGGSDVETGPLNWESYTNPSLIGTSTDQNITIFDKTPNPNSLLGCTYVGNSGSVAASLPTINAMKLKNNGTRLYCYNQSANRIYQFNLSTAYNIKALTPIGSFLLSVPSSTYDFDVSEDGTKLIVLGQTSGNIQTLYEYTLSTAWTISSAVYQSRSQSINAQDSQMRYLKISKNGLRAIVFGDANKSIFQYTLGSYYNLTSLTFNTSINLSSLVVDPNFSNIRGMSAGSNGTKLLIAYTPTGGGIDRIRELNLSGDLLLSGASQGELTTIPSSTLGGGSTFCIEATEDISLTRNDILLGNTNNTGFLGSLLNLKAKGYWFNHFVIQCNIPSSMSGDLYYKGLNIGLGTGLLRYSSGNIRSGLVMSLTYNERGSYSEFLNFVSREKTKIEAIINGTVGQESVFRLEIGYLPIL